MNLFTSAFTKTCMQVYILCVNSCFYQIVPDSLANFRQGIFNSYGKSRTQDYCRMNTHNLQKWRRKSSAILDRFSKYPRPIQWDDSLVPSQTCQGRQVKRAENWRNTAHNSEVKVNRENFRAIICLTHSRTYRCRNFRSGGKALNVESCALQTMALLWSLDLFVRILHLAPSCGKNNICVQ